MLSGFYKGKKVLVTGHTGFKGSWLCRILHLLGAEVYGYSLDPPTNPNLFEILNSTDYVNSRIGDISDYNSLFNYYSDIEPDVVFHLAAQPLVREGYREPRRTYLSNVMGTVNILECIRLVGAKSFLNITTDKVYYNVEQPNHLYKENERLDGFDPYSNSKSCSELVTSSYVRSYSDKICPVSTARAGNVIGGGDFASERIIPDCVRSALSNAEIILRNPNSVRPYQHVLEPLFAYLIIAMKQTQNKKYAGNYNIGPNDEECVTTGYLTDTFCKKWGGGLSWKSLNDNGPHEANYLKLDNSKLTDTFGIKPLWHIQETVEKIIEWTKVWSSGGDIINCTDNQIKEYFSGRGINV